MLKKLFVLATAALVAAAPSSTLAQEFFSGERSGVAAGVYFSIPLGGGANGKPQSGFRLQMVHDYRDSGTQNNQVIQMNALDLRFAGENEPILYVANLPVTGREARRQNLVGPGTLVTVLVVGAAAVGAVVIIDALKDDEDLDERQCFLPEGCP